MRVEERFMPYSSSVNGDLKKYLREHDGSNADNAFHGPEYFFVIKREGLIVPGRTHIVVNRGFTPDVGYLVNSDFLLESKGPGEHNMSFIGAEEGIYDPKDVLKNQRWSVSGLII